MTASNIPRQGTVERLNRQMSCQRSRVFVERGDFINLSRLLRKYLRISDEQPSGRNHWFLTSTWQFLDISDGNQMEPSVSNKNGRQLDDLSSILCLVEDVHEQHDPGRWIHTPWTAGTKRARSSHTTRRKRSNKKRSAYSTRTVSRFMLGLIRDRMDWWFDGSTPTENSKCLRRELAFFLLIIFFQPLADRVRNCVLGICVAMHGQWSLSSCGDGPSYTIFQGVVVGALFNMPLSDRLGLGNVSF